MQTRPAPLCLASTGLLLAFVLVACSRISDPEELFGRGDYSAALAGFGVRADAGDAAAENYLGVHYYLGLGAERDLKRAVGWFQRAATRGHAGAQRNLGIMYLRGLGVRQDKVRAYSWFYQSWRQGDPIAIKYLDFVSDYITPNQSTVARRWVEQFMRDARS